MSEPDTSALRKFLNSLSQDAQAAFAARSGTTVAYIRKVMSTGERFGESLVISFDRESRGKVPCESLRPDVDWAYLRGSRSEPSASTTNTCD